MQGYGREKNKKVLCYLKCCFFSSRASVIARFPLPMFSWLEGRNGPKCLLVDQKWPSKNRHKLLQQKKSDIYTQILQKRCVSTSSSSLTYKTQLKLLQWPLLKQEMINFFSQKPSRDSTINIEAREWPRFASKEQIYAEGYVPAIISKYGECRKICLERKLIENIAFDEPEGHLSNLFAGRLYRIHVGKWIEECIVSHVSSDPVEKHLYFIRFNRHVSGIVSEVDIPVTIVGMLGCPAYIQGYHVEVAMPTIRCEVISNYIPPPFQVDVSKLKYQQPYSAITLSNIQHLLPKDGTVRFHRKYDLNTQEVVWSYEVGKLVEQPLPEDWEDENFLNKKGKRIHLTYKGHKHKQ